MKTLQPLVTKLLELMGSGFGIMPLTLYGHIKTHSNGPLYSNTVIGTLAVDGWAVTFGAARRGLGRLWPRPVPFSLYHMYSPPVSG